MNPTRVVILTPVARQIDPGTVRDLVRPGDRLICADGGAALALDLGLVPDLVVGDFDSLDEATLERVRAVCPVRGFPRRKDKTDTHLAIEAALELFQKEVLRSEETSRPGDAALPAEGAPELVICGALGDRFDHSLGLVLLLAGLAEATGVAAPAPGLPRVRLVGARQEAFVLGPGHGVELVGRPGDTVSLLPLTPEVSGVTTAGLAYPLAGAALRWGETLGVSNEMTGTRAAIETGRGVLLVTRLEVKAWVGE